MSGVVVRKVPMLQLSLTIPRGIHVELRPEVQRWSDDLFFRVVMIAMEATVLTISDSSGSDMQMSC